MVRSSARHGSEGGSSPTREPPRKLIHPCVATLTETDEIVKPRGERSFHATAV